MAGEQHLNILPDLMPFMSDLMGSYFHTKHSTSFRVPCLFWPLDVDVGRGGLTLVRRDAGDVGHGVLLRRFVRRRGRRGVRGLRGAAPDSSPVNFRSTGLVIPSVVKFI